MNEAELKGYLERKGVTFKEEKVIDMLPEEASQGSNSDNREVKENDSDEN